MSGGSKRIVCGRQQHPKYIMMRRSLAEKTTNSAVEAHNPHFSNKYFICRPTPVHFVCLPIVAFRAAVDWSERWIQGIIVFHLSLWVLFIFTRKSFGAQVRWFAQHFVDKFSLRVHR